MSSIVQIVGAVSSEPVDWRDTGAVVCTGGKLPRLLGESARELAPLDRPKGGLLLVREAHRQAAVSRSWAGERVVRRMEAHGLVILRTGGGEKGPREAFSSASPGIVDS